MSEPESLESRLTMLETRLNQLTLKNSIDGIFWKIERDLRDLYSAATIAEFRDMDEDGYIPERKVDHGWRNVIPAYEVRWYVPSKSAQKERLNALQDLATISQHVEEARSTLMDRDASMDYERINEIGLYISRFQHDLRHRLFEIDGYRIRFWGLSLNELAFCIRGVFISSCETIDYIENRYRISMGKFQPVPRDKR